MSDDDDPVERTKREVPARKGWMAPTVGADTVAPARGGATRPDVIPPTLALSVFDPPEQRFAETAELGRGGMGRVVEAVDRALGRAVAIKQSLATASVDLARFEREVRITAQLQHPSVIPILDVGRDPDGRPFYIMRKIEGEPLADRVAAAPTVRERVALISALLGAIDAVAYAHAKGFVHRDIKPWNILLGPFGETLMIDWGIARKLDEPPEDTAALEAADTGHALTRLGVAQGTPGFLAPEQARGEVVDTRADVYSLGATLFFVWTGQIPYGRIEADAAISRAAAGEPPDFSAIPDEVPRELVAITTKAMAAEPRDRYADAGELAADLRRFLAGQLVAAHAYTTRERIVRWVRRHRLAVAVSALALLAVAIVSTLSIRQVIHDRDAARAARALAEQRADENLLDRARSLVETDPTSAIAALRELRPDSPLWPAVRPIARVAVRGGVERRIGMHPRMVSALAFSPDGNWLASGSDEITLHELPRGTPRVLARGWIDRIVWWGPRTIAFLTRDGDTTRARVIDLDTSAIHELEVDTPSDLIVVGDRLVALERGGLVSIHRRDRTRVVAIERDATAIGAAGDTLAVATRGSLIVDGGRGPRTTVLPDHVMTVTVSGDRDRVATLGGNGVVREWSIADLEAAPRVWERGLRGNNIGYAGTTLLAWTADGSGFVALSGPMPAPLWTARDRKFGIVTRHIVPFDRGALLATDHGAFAIYTPHGTTPVPHRQLGVTRIDIDRSGRWVAYGLGDGSVLLLDLGFALPRSIPVTRATELVTIAAGKTLVTGSRGPTGSGGPEVREAADALRIEALSILDPETRALISTGRSIPGTLVLREGEIFVGSDQLHHWIWNVRGELLFELDNAMLVRLERGVVYWADPGGTFWSRATRRASSPVELGRLPAGARLRAGPGTGTGPMVTGFDRIGDQLVLTLRTLDDIQSFSLSASQFERIPTPPGYHSLAGRIGGVWWTEKEDDRTLWRAGAKIPLRHAVNRVLFAEDRAWAIGEDTLTVIDAMGRIERELALPAGARLVKAGKDGVLATDVHGIVEIVPATNVRSTLRTFGSVDGVAASPDGSQVVALTVARDGSKSLDYWSDVVPAEPTALRAFLDTLTNARLEAGSDAIRWD